LINAVVEMATTFKGFSYDSLMEMPIDELYFIRNKMVKIQEREKQQADRHRRNSWASKR
jgi:hypothetical protein